MVPQEKQNSIETTQTKEVAKENNSHKEKLQKIFETSTLKPETIENLKKILSLVDINELNDFIIWEPDLDDVINQWKELDLTLTIEWIIDNFLMKFWESKIDKKVQEKIKKEKFDEDKSWKSKEGDIAKDIKNTNINQLGEKQEKWLALISKNKEKYEKLFAGNPEVLSILNEIEQFKETPWEELKNAIDKLSKYVKEHGSEFFDTIAKSWDKALYEETISSFKNLWVTIPAHIPTEIYKVPDTPESIPKPIVAQFPWANPQDIEKRWNLVSYGDKTIDLKTGRAFISGEWWYAIETSMKVPNSLDLRVKYQKERLEILETIKNKENTLEQIKEYKNTLTFEKNLHAEYEKISLNQDIDSNLRKTEIESQLKLIVKYKELAEERFPRLKKDPEVFADDIKKEIEKEKEKLTTLKTNFDADMQELLKSWQDEIKARDEKIRETIKFLDILWINNIHQNDLEKIFKQVNYNKNIYLLTKNIDLKEWFPDAVWEKHKYKLELIKLFSPMYEKMWIDINPHSLVAWIRSPNMPTDNIFKTKLEQIWVTRWWALNLNTTLQLLTPKQETQKKENTQETKKEAT